MLDVTDDVIEAEEELVVETVLVHVFIEVGVDVPLAVTVFDTGGLAEIVREPTADTVARIVRVPLPDTVDVFDGRIVSDPVDVARTLTELVVEAVTVLLCLTDAVAVVEPVPVLVGLTLNVEVVLPDTDLVAIVDALTVIVNGFDRDGATLRDVVGDPVCVFDIGGLRVSAADRVGVLDPGGDLESVGLALGLLLELTEPVEVFEDVDDFVRSGDPVIVLDVADVSDAAGLDDGVLEGMLDSVGASVVTAVFVK